MNQIILLLGFSLMVTVASAQTKSVAENLAQQQLDGYNKKDIEAFLIPYSDSVEVYQFPNKLLYKGKTTMRNEYKGMFANTIDLHCTVTSRMVLGNTVIYEESVLFNKAKPPFKAIAIYVIENDKIAKVYFIM